MNIEIPPIDLQAQKAARARLDRLTKPVGSLGRLEELAATIAGIKAQPLPSIDRKAIFTVAGDHGVVAEGVSAYPQEVTVQMVANFLHGGAAINVLARHAGAEVIVVDAGVSGDCSGLDGSHPLHVRKIRKGTGNMAKGLAMTREEAQRIVEEGIRFFRERHALDPFDLIGLGDMGIGNTTASSVLTAVFTGASPSEVTGRGTGLTDPHVRRKIEVIEQVLKRHRPDPSDPIACLSRVGGLEIGFLAGITLGAASSRVPVMLDGFITGAAALVACALAPAARDYLIASHCSVEPGHRAILRHLQLSPLLDLQMRLGEGTGAALGMFLAEAGVKVLREMATFESAGVSEKEK